LAYEMALCKDCGRMEFSRRLCLELRLFGHCARAARGGNTNSALVRRLVKTTGDGVLLEFPSVVAAVECAIAIQKMMAERNAAVPEAKRILYRVGVNLGDVLIDGEDILGDGVNIAARLEGICESGGVCLSGSAYEHIQGRISADFADLGDQSLKNIAKPVRAYALTPKAIAAAKVEAAVASASTSQSPELGPVSHQSRRSPLRRKSVPRLLCSPPRSWRCSS
jgi:class 3 adenylate cyclase